MHPRQLPRSLARYAPVAAALLGSAAFAAPAGAAAAGPAPTIQITYNTADILAADFDATTATVKRGGVTLATGAFGGDPALAPGELGLNSAHNVAGGIPTGCWATITPQILPGDSVTVGTETVTIPDITAQTPVVENGAVVVHGTVGAGVDMSLLGVQLWPANAARFGTGRQFLDSLKPQGFSAEFAMDPGSATNWTARFTGLPAGDLALASTATAIVEWDPAALAAVHPPVLTLVDYEAGVTPGPVAGCAAPYTPNEAKSVSRSMISTANAGDLTITGVSQPGSSATGITLIDANGKTVSAPASGVGTWTAIVPASSLAGLADGAIKIGSTFSIGNGATVGGLLRKDATAPAAPTASLAAGTYRSTQSVALKAAEGTVYYTTDGSAPSASSTAYANAVSVARSQTIKAVAVDAAGNVSNVAEFGYAIAAPIVPITAPVISLPKLKVEGLTLTRRMSVRSARRSGVSAIIYAPDGAKIARIRVLRGKKVVQTINRKITRDGVIEVRVPSTKKARKALKRGSYRIEVRVGQSLTNLGAARLRTLKLV